MNELRERAMKHRIMLILALLSITTSVMNMTLINLSRQGRVLWPDVAVIICDIVEVSITGVLLVYLIGVMRSWRKERRHATTK
jgi:hypothetical protein